MHLKSSSISSLQIGHAFKWHLVCQEFPKDNPETVDVNLVIVMLLLSLTQSHCAIQLQNNPLIVGKSEIEKERGQGFVYADGTNMEFLWYRIALLKNTSQSAKE